MLKEFKFSNFKSFKEKQILSLEAMNFKDPNLDDFNTVSVGRDILLKSAVIYGHNSFGKSNILNALSTMKKIIKNSNNTDFKPTVDYFKLDEESATKPSFFELTFILNERGYRYGFEIFEESIKTEWLYKKNVREVNIFERSAKENTSITISSSYTQLHKYTKFTRDTELFLGSMIKNNEVGEIHDVYHWLTHNIRIISSEHFSPSITSDMFLKGKSEKNSIVKALQCADINISDIAISREEEKLEDHPPLSFASFLKGIRGTENITDEKFIHHVFNHKSEQVGSVEFNLRERESQGTIKLFSLLGPILDSLEHGFILFIDELDSKLHHEIVKYIVSLFHSLDKNQKNAQLIFNTHDFYLLNENNFRKDQIYFTDKDKYGRSTLDSLGDFKEINSKTKILDHYLAGNFGAIGKIKSSD